MSAEWNTSVGWTGMRDEIAATYGGSAYRGMVAPRASSNLLLFTDPKVGRANGYEFDGWSPDGRIFFYTGMGRIGPQRMQSGNVALRDHKMNGRVVRLFGVSGKAARGKALIRVYLGEFELDQKIPLSVEDAPDAEGDMRTVFVFHLRPVGAGLRRDEDTGSKSQEPTIFGSAAEVSLENHAVGEFRRAATEGGTGVKREQELVEAFQKLLLSRGNEVNRFKVYPKGSAMPLFTDIHDMTAGILYEAKADATRNSVRAGLGQLLDYRRYVGDRPCRLLLPAKPNDDLLELLGDHGMDVVWRADNGRAFHLYSKGSTGHF